MIQIRDEITSLTSNRDSKLPDEIVNGQSVYYSDEKRNALIKELENEYDQLAENAKLEYIPQIQTILNKYKSFPKNYSKWFKDSDIKTVADSKGNTWYEVDVPKDYLNREIKFNKGGLIKRTKSLKKKVVVH